MRELIIRPDAEAEMAEAYDWYEACVSGLGSDFLLALDAVLNATARNPKQFPVVYKDIRRALVRRFPYAVFYVVDSARIIVLAVMHVRQNPKIWKTRK